MEQKPDGDALVLIDPEEDEKPRHKYPNNDRDKAHGGRNKSGYPMLNPCNKNTETWEK